MKSFRTELENEIVERDIFELERKIYQHKTGKIDDESFRSLRLARGVYGQRQKGVQMVRIKIPLGILNPNQLKRIARISDHYSNGQLHLTTRQDIQIHHVSLDDTPQLWADLEKDRITLREACGNTVRNITASPFAGVDKDEPFDITDYAWTLFEFLLRNPIGQEMGRKFKIAFSASHKDLARTYMHDLGFIPVFEGGEKGFRVLFGGGLGAQPALAEVILEFLPINQLVPFTVALIKVFDQNGERNKRNKARFKFLLKEQGFDEIKAKIAYERSFLDELKGTFIPKPNYFNEIKKANLTGVDSNIYLKWKKTNVIPQKQAGFFSVIVKISNGNLSSHQAIKLAQIIKDYSIEEARLTIDQNIVIRSITERAISVVYQQLIGLDLASFGANTIRDITSCPGTSTCNLGITATYSAANAIDEVLVKEYLDIIESKDIKIKMSGCMNACGQHTVADIGFHGSTIKANGDTIPALQVLLGGSSEGNGSATYADKIIKIPTRRVQQLIRTLLTDYLVNKQEENHFSAYYKLKGKHYFYDLLKPIAQTDQVEPFELLDWGSEERFQMEIGVGECAGVKIDLVKTLLFEAYEKLEDALFFVENKKNRDAMYAANSSMIQSAKAFLVQRQVPTNSKVQIIEAFEAYYDLVKIRFLEDSFSELMNEINQSNLSEKKVIVYIQQAERFHLAIDELTNEK